MECAPFEACGYKWKLILYLNGSTEATKKHIALFLRLVTEGVETPEIKTRLSVCYHGGNSTGCFSSIKPRPEGTLGRTVGHTLMSHADLLAPRARHLKDSERTFEATLQVVGLENRAPTPADKRCAAAPRVLLPPPPPPALGAEWAALLASGDLADVTLRCDGEAFRAHALVLCLRSPVLRASLIGARSHRSRRARKPAVVMLIRPCCHLSL